MNAFRTLSCMSFSKNVSRVSFVARYEFVRSICHDAWCVSMHHACFVIWSLSKTHTYATRVAYTYFINMIFVCCCSSCNMRIRNFNKCSQCVRETTCVELRACCLLSNTKHLYVRNFCVVTCMMRDHVECVKKRFVFACNALDMRSCMNTSCVARSFVTRAYTRYSTRVDVQTLHIRIQMRVCFM